MTAVTGSESRSATNPRVSKPRVAVLIPCYNEALTVGDVVREFRAQLPEADIYVFDNNSTDGTAAEAQRAGAIVRHEGRQGKGYVVQSMFRGVDSDIYIMIDGDGTYSPAAVHELMAPVLRGEADMVVGSRLHAAARSEFKSLNRFGNQMFLTFVNWAFRVQLTDILSGYRVFNRRCVKGLALFGGGFETETELTIKALDRGYRIMEVPTALSPRPAGSFSKIRIVQDGFLIVSTILSLFRDYKPLTFFGGVGLMLIAVALVPGVMVIREYLATGLVPRLPSAVLAVGLVLSGMLSITAGLILHTIARRSREFSYYLQILADEMIYNPPQTAAGAPPAPDGVAASDGRTHSQVG